jgi:hypothetical protein
MTPRILVYCPLSPSTPKVYGRTLQSIFAMDWAGPLDVVFGRHDHGPTDRGTAYREITEKYNGARDLALLGGYDALLTIESDMIVPPLTLERLTRLDADVAYGLYVSRHGKHQWLAYLTLYETSGTSLSADRINAQAAWGQAIEVAGVGLGCTLIWRHVLEAIPFRWEEGGVANDWYFSLDLQARGYKQMTDCGVVCGHIASEPDPRIYWPDPEAERLYSIEPIGGGRAVTDRVSVPVGGQGAVVFGVRKEGAECTQPLPN